MVKGNQAIPHIHQRKHWNPSSSQKGNVKVWLDQPKRKEHRRRLRLLKAKKCFPRPLRLFRPIVNCPTVRYNSKRRLGNGFSCEEIKAAGITPQYAATIGICVDRRRRNLSEEGLNTNVQRLKNYLGKLVLFPINKDKHREGECTEEEYKNATQARNVNVRPVSVHLEAPRALTAEEKSKDVYKFLKKHISAARFVGERMKRARKKADAAAAEAAKKSKQ